jgi:hypothetical protein
MNKSLMQSSHLPHQNTDKKFYINNHAQPDVLVLFKICNSQQVGSQTGYVMTPCVGNVVLRRKPQSTFCVSVRL